MSSSEEEIIISSTKSSQRLHVTSEIYAETDFKCSSLSDKKSLSRFLFEYPLQDNGEDEEESSEKKSNANNFGDSVNKDKDGDLLVTRRPKPKLGTIEIEHHKSTDLTLVGLQVWRGALLLADYIIHNRQFFEQKNVLELGSGVGLTGIVAAMYAKQVICTDINLGEILKTIESNIQRNYHLIGGENSSSVKKNNMLVMELDFKQLNWSPMLESHINETDIILAADVIYDDDLTNALVETIEKLLTPPTASSSPSNRNKIIFIALEKRYVFTVADLESLAPCYEYFLARIEQLRYQKLWSFQSIPINFPQYFQYERVKDLVLLKLCLICK